MNERQDVNCRAVDDALAVDVARKARLGGIDAGGRIHVAVN